MDARTPPPPKMLQELNDEEIAALELQGAAGPMEVEGELPDMNADEMAK